jgi:hypothetical protein
MFIFSPKLIASPISKQPPRTTGGAYLTQVGSRIIQMDDIQHLGKKKFDAPRHTMQRSRCEINNY